MGGAIALAERLRAAVYLAPLGDRASFPEDHPLFRGPLGMSVKAISDQLAGYDLAVVIGARVGDSLPGDPKIAIDLLLELVAEGAGRAAPEPMARPRLLPTVASSRSCTRSCATTSTRSSSRSLCSRRHRGSRDWTSRD